VGQRTATKLEETVVVSIIRTSNLISYYCKGGMYVVPVPNYLSGCSPSAKSEPPGYLVQLLSELEDLKNNGVLYA